jgi:hypothetical protein
VERCQLLHHASVPARSSHSRQSRYSRASA